MPALTDYPFEIHPLSGEDGGGYLITFPIIPGCMPAWQSGRKMRG